MKTSHLPGNIALWQTGGALSACPAEPEALAKLHPLWAQDMRLCAPFSPWLDELGRAWLRAAGADIERQYPKIAVFNDCTSALDLAWVLAGQKEPEDFASLLAASQSAGRGQLRRAWFSGPGNVYGAIYWPLPPKRLDTLLTLLVARLCVEFFANLGLELLYKWPNDLLWQGRKVGGMLIEQRGKRLVAGIGINLALAPPEDILREEHACPAASLAAGGLGFGPLGLWANLVRSLQIGYARVLATTNAIELTAYLEERLAWHSQEVEVSRAPGQWLRGRLLGLAEDGGLRFAPFDGSAELVLHSGGLRPVKDDAINNLD